MVRILSATLLRFRSLVCFQGEQDQTQTVDLEQYSIERRLIEQRSAEHRFVRCFWENLKILKPFLPGRVQMSFDGNAVSHLWRFPPFVQDG
ncbi:hypothetical protein KSD_92940 [Ktedonobacter sp. SOSP1-85]|nr:hypothetical protein KSD_92940 [Ktedonobacter sp. SOSP1-85]